MSEKFIVNYMKLGEKLRDKRVNTGLSQAEVSEEIDLSESFYGHIERGSKVLSVESLVKLARYYNLSLDFLLLDSTGSENEERLQLKFDSITRDKTPEEREYLLKVLKVFSDNIEEIR